MTAHRQPAAADLLNATDAPQSVHFRLSVGFTIESEVLNDPRAVNPFTGMPLAGKLDSSVGVIFVQETLQLGEFTQRLPDYSRQCIAGLTSRQGLIGAGVPEDLIPRLFKKPCFSYSALTAHNTATSTPANSQNSKRT